MRVCLTRYGLQTVGGKTGIDLSCNANRTEMTAGMRGCETGGGGGQSPSCDVNRIRKAYYFYSYVGTFVPISKTQHSLTVIACLLDIFAPLR